MRERDGVRWRLNRRLLVEHTRQFLEPRGRRLEEVVELAELLHRFEEPAQVQEERREHADAHPPVDREPTAVEDHDGGGEPADELHARPVRGGQSLRPDVRPAVAIVEVLEDLLVSRLATERVHRPDPSEALHEVHDHERDRVPRRPVRALGLIAEPSRQHP